MAKFSKIRGAPNGFDDVLTADYRGKKAKFSKRVGEGEMQKKVGATDQPRYNGFRVISIRVLTTLQCTVITLYTNIRYNIKIHYNANLNRMNP